MFLDQILCHSGLNSGQCFVGDRLLWTNFPAKSGHHEDRLKNKIRLSSVNINYDSNVWDWDLVTAIFKCPESEALKTLELSDYKNFVRRVTDYFKPTNGKFCREELSNLSSRFKARTACYLLDFLIASTSPEAEKILDDFVKDIQVRTEIFFTDMFKIYFDTRKKTKNLSRVKKSSLKMKFCTIMQMSTRALVQIMHVLRHFIFEGLLFLLYSIIPQ